MFYNVHFAIILTHELISVPDRVDTIAEAHIVIRNRFVRRHRQLMAAGLSDMDAYDELVEETADAEPFLV